MCARFYVVSPADEISRLLDVPLDAELEPRYNIAPQQHAWIGTSQGWEDGVWGIQPNWGNQLLINARSESVDQKPTFRRIFQRHRCIVPASGFYEWDEVPAETPSLFGDAPSKVVKQPYAFFIDGGEPFAMAGIYEPASHHFVVLTCEPNALLAQIHDRMPVILDRHDVMRWLDTRSTAESLADLMQPFPASRMARRRVSRKLNNVRNDSPSLWDES